LKEVLKEILIERFAAYGAYRMTPKK